MAAAAAAGEEEERGGFMKKLTTMISSTPPLPLLPISNTNIESRPIVQNLQNLQLGKFAFTLAVTATTGLIFSDKFPAAEAHYFVILGFMAACAAVLNGMLFGRVSLQLVGTTLVLLSLYGLVASFLPSSLSWACWIFGAFSLIPFLSLLSSHQTSSSPNITTPSI